MSKFISIFLLSAFAVFAPVALTAQVQDPFADLSAVKQPEIRAQAKPWWKKFVAENFGFREEIMSQFDTNDEANGASRQSLGFEVQKKFSSDTSTVASFDFQGRFVRRDGFNPIQNDLEGRERQGWSFEYHNVYFELYNIFNPLLTDAQRRKAVGKFNFRAGRFYVPFGLNLQTDTHGTVLQLSNERNFGFERDWFGGFQGSLNRHLNYDAYYLTGSGYALKYKGQSGLATFRLSLGNRYISLYGLEGGISLLGGERLSTEASERLHAAPGPVQTERAGIDGRYRRAVPTGLLTFTSEISGGRDNHDSVRTQLHQSEYLRASRHWGVATQYRRFQQDRAGADASVAGEFTWYFRNDVGNSNSHWIKFNIEKQLQQMTGRPRTLLTLQYYLYR